MMSIEEDKKLEESICEELGKIDGGSDIIEKFYRSTYALFWRYARSIICRFGFLKEIAPEDVIQDFWVEKIYEQKVICKYIASKGSTLRGYLLAILRKYIMDSIRKRWEEHAKRDDSWFDLTGFPDSKEFFGHSGSEDDLIMEREKEFRLIYEVLDILSDISPRDAFYIREHDLEGRTYEDIARLELPKNATNKEIKRRANRIKKQVTRPGTGSRAKFKILYERKLKE